MAPYPAVSYDMLKKKIVNLLQWLGLNFLLRKRKWTVVSQNLSTHTCVLWNLAIMKSPDKDKTKSAFSNSHLLDQPSHHYEKMCLFGQGKVFKYSNPFYLKDIKPLGQLLEKLTWGKSFLKFFFNPWITNRRSYKSRPCWLRRRAWSVQVWQQEPTNI